MVDEDLDELLAELRSPDPETFEGAYACLRPIAAEIVPMLLKGLSGAADPYERGKFVELLGHSKNKTAVPALELELAHPDQDVRQWAVTALREIASPEAQVLVADYERTHPSEF
jgi:HEAT repeat protein